MKEFAEVTTFFYLLFFLFLFFFFKRWFYCVYTLTNTASIAMANIKYWGDLPDAVVLQGIRPNFEVQTQASICMPDE